MEQILVELGRLMPKLWEMSLTGGIVILAVLCARVLLYRAPKIFSYVLWSVVLLRLLCPVSVSTPVSLFCLLELQEREVVYTQPEKDAVGMVQNPAGQQAGALLQEQTTDTVQTQNEAAEDATRSVWTQKNVWFGVIWLAGMIFVLLYGSRGLGSLKKSLRQSEKMRRNVYETNLINTPFVMGVLSPKIYLPMNLTEEEQDYIILHERTHIARGDHISRLIFFLALAIHWFNPLVWVAFYLSEKDMEMSCDEAVLKAMDEDIRAEYATSLLGLATGRRRLTGMPLAFGEGDTKARVKNIMRYRKPAVGVAVVAALAVGLLLIALGSNPMETQADAATQILLTNPVGENTDDASGEQNTEMEETKAMVYEALDKWAKAFCDRDAETIIAMCDGKILEGLTQSVGLEAVGNQATMGFSSPWPWDDESDYQICLVTDSTAEILYYAWTSDPHVAVWRETLTFHKAGSDYIVDEENLAFLDAISSGSEYMQAYPDGIIGGRMDHRINGVGESLNDNAKANPNTTGYAELFTPERAARYLLNLLDNPNKVVLTAGTPNEDGSVTVEISFLEDGKTVWANMWQPYGEDGIWLVQSDWNVMGTDVADGGSEADIYNYETLRR